MPGRYGPAPPVRRSARLWPRVVAASDVYERHQQRRDRPIPMVVLEPLGSAPVDRALRGAGTR